MSVEIQPQSPTNKPKGYISYPPEVPCPDPEPFFSARFVIFSILVIGAGALGGAIQSGRISLNQYFNTPKAQVLVSAANPKAHGSPAPSATPAPAFKPDTFIVTSISIGQPSFAIINGTSRVVGDHVEAPGVAGWKVRQIIDGAVVLQNGPTLVSLPLTTPGIKPLDDALHPLN
jgi:hypothetical protein